MSFPLLKSRCFASLQLDSALPPSLLAPIHSGFFCYSNSSLKVGKCHFGAVLITLVVMIPWHYLSYEELKQDEMSSTFSKGPLFSKTAYSKSARNCCPKG